MTIKMKNVPGFGGNVKLRDGGGKMSAIRHSFTKSSDASLSVFTIDGVTVSHGCTIASAAAINSVSVVAIPTHPSANAVITGGDSLVTGDNAVVVTVTAEDGVTTSVYAVTVHRLSNDSTLRTLTVDNVAVESGSTYAVSSGTTSVSITAIPSISSDTVVVTGGNSLSVGDNEIDVVVTAEDGTSTTYRVNVHRKSADTSLAVLTLDGSSASDGDTYAVTSSVSSVTVVATPSAYSVGARAVVTGGSGLVTGDNTLTVVVMAEDAAVTQTYTVTLHRKSADTSLSVFRVGSSNVTNGSTVNVSSSTNSVAVTATATTAAVGATVSYTGNSGLVTGNNTLTVTVTAEDTSVQQTYTVTLHKQSADISLSAFKIGLTNVTNGSTVNVSAATTSVTVTATPTFAGASVSVTGGTSLATGNNTVTVVVTAEDPAITQTYTVTVHRYSNNTSLSSTTINGVSYALSTSVTTTAQLVYGTTIATIVATPSVVTSTASVTGGTGLVSGPNSASVRVTAEDGTIATYNINLLVASRITYSVGAGGSGGTTGSSDGVAGSTSSLTFSGTTLYGYGGGAGSVTAATTGVGGAASGGTTNSTGGTGAVKPSLSTIGGTGGAGLGGAGSSTSSLAAGSAGAAMNNVANIYAALAAMSISYGGSGSGGLGSGAKGTGAGGSTSSFGGGGGGAGAIGGSGGTAGRGGGGGGGHGDGTSLAYAGGSGGAGAIILQLDAATPIMITLGTSYTVPFGTTSIKAWVIGGGGGGGTGYVNSSSGGGGAGGIAYKQWTGSW